MNNFDLKERLWGGIFGLIAIIAAIAEMISNGLSTTTMFGAIKDIAGTLIVVILLVTVIKSLIPPKYKMSFEERLETALTKWQTENAKLIVKKPESGIPGKYYGLSLKTDMTSFYKPSSDTAKAGWFVRIPIIEADNYNKKGIEIQFSLNRGTFFEGRKDLTEEQKNTGVSNLSNLIYIYIEKHFGDIVDHVSSSGKPNITITVALKNPITSDKDIEQLIGLIHGVYQGYLVAAYIDLVK